ncbi:transcription factor [Sarocladium strictum]
MSSPAQPDVQVRTCNHCRQRRVKCDRQLPACSNCIRATISCTYPPGRGRAPKRPRANLVPQLSDRLGRLESLLDQFKAAATGGTQASSQPEYEGEGQVLEHEFSRLEVNDSRSHYMNHALWVTLSNEVEELRDLLFEPSVEHASHREHSIASSATTPATPFAAPQQGLNAAVFGNRAIPSPLLHHHPSLPQAVTLFAAFTERVATMVTIFHMPTLSRTYWDAVACLGSLDAQTEALMFAIHYAAVVSLTPEQCLQILNETREDALERYRFAVEQALAQSNLLSTQSMTVLQAAVLFLATLPNENDSRAAWALTSLVFHIARTMGIHRDGSMFGLKPFETELRRRLWWQICSIDSRSAEYHRMEPIAQDFMSDTKPPLHINDADLSPDMVEAPAERWDQATDLTLTLVRCEASQVGTKMSRLRYKGQANKSENNLHMDDNDLVFKQRHALVEGLEARYREKYLPICDSCVPFQLLSSTVAQVIVRRFWLTTQYAMRSQEKDKSGKPTESPGQVHSATRDELFRTSTEILETSVTLLTNELLSPFAWYAKTHIQWGAAAMAFVLSELCSRPQSAQCDRAWDCVTVLYDAWNIDGTSHDETRLVLWRPVRRLMAKARYVREMQRTGSGQPNKTSCWTENRDAVSDLSSPSVVSSYPTSIYNNNWHETEQQAAGLVPEPEPGNKGSQRDALQRVLGTETLDSFMDLSPEWPWVDTETASATWLSGFDVGLTRFS